MMGCLPLKLEENCNSCLTIKASYHLSYTSQSLEFPIICIIGIGNPMQISETLCINYTSHS